MWDAVLSKENAHVGDDGTHSAVCFNTDSRTWQTWIWVPTPTTTQL